MTNPLVKPSLWLEPKDPHQGEIVGLRTVHSKTYLMPDGAHKMLATARAVHYKDDPADINEQWKDIDLTVVDDGGKQVIHKALYDLEIYTDKVGYHYVSKRGGIVDVELVEVDGQPVDNQRFQVRVEGNQLFWDDVADGVDMKVQLRPMSAEIFKKLADVQPSRGQERKARNR